MRSALAAVALVLGVFYFLFIRGDEEQAWLLRSHSLQRNQEGLGLQKVFDEVLQQAPYQQEDFRSCLKYRINKCNRNLTLEIRNLTQGSSEYNETLHDIRISTNDFKRAAINFDPLHLSDAVFQFVQAQIDNTDYNTYVHEFWVCIHDRLIGCWSSQNAPP